MEPGLSLRSWSWYWNSQFFLNATQPFLAPFLIIAHGIKQYMQLILHRLNRLQFFALFLFNSLCFGCYYAGLLHVNTLQNDQESAPESARPFHDGCRIRHVNVSTVEPRPPA